MGQCKRFKSKSHHAKTKQVEGDSSEHPSHLARKWLRFRVETIKRNLAWVWMWILADLRVTDRKLSMFAIRPVL